MPIREAGLHDVDAMVSLSETHRMQLARYQPTFWRKADDSAEKQAAFFRILLPLDDICAVVAERDGVVEAFAIARLQPAPPVYAPGGPVCLVDDFCVAADSDWSEVGAEILEAVERWGKERGAVMSVVVCPQQSDSKREWLATAGFAVSAEWRIRPL